MPPCFSVPWRKDDKVNCRFTVCILDVTNWVAQIQMESEQSLGGQLMTIFNKSADFYFNCLVISSDALFVLTTVQNPKYSIFLSDKEKQKIIKFEKLET